MPLFAKSDTSETLPPTCTWLCSNPASRLAYASLLCLESPSPSSSRLSPLSRNASTAAYMPVSVRYVSTPSYVALPSPYVASLVRPCVANVVAYSNAIHLAVVAPVSGPASSCSYWYCSLCSVLPSVRAYVVVALSVGIPSSHRNVFLVVAASCQPGPSSYVIALPPALPPTSVTSSVACVPTSSAVATARQEGGVLVLIRGIAVLRVVPVARLRQLIRGTNSLRLRRIQTTPTQRRGRPGVTGAAVASNVRKPGTSGFTPSSGLMVAKLNATTTLTVGSMTHLA